MIALYAIVLQALVVAAVPVSGYDPLGNAICARGTAAPEAPADEPRHHHGACCILACAGANLGFLAAAYVSIIFAALRVAPFVFARRLRTNTSSPLKFYFAARGPPPIF